MKAISNRTWKITNPENAEKIKARLLDNSGQEDAKITNPYEAWRIKFADATATFYKKGSLFVTDSNNDAILELHSFVESLVGSKFVAPSKKYLIGFDETGKGEVLGHTVLVGVAFPAGIASQLERDIGVADSKVKHEIAYWDDIYRKIDFYQTKGLSFNIQKIPPWQIDQYNINKFFDITYQRMLLLFVNKFDFAESRIVFDDYGIGFNLDRYLKSIQRASAEVVKTFKADDNYIESKVASLIAKREQQKVLLAIANNPDFQVNGVSIGSGNAGDPNTLNWLKAWKAKGVQWPWFVKRSFKTIREIDGQKPEKDKIYPSINEKILSEEFRKKFENGELNIKSLSVVCPCGAVSKSIKLTPQNNQTTPICISCQKEIKDISLPLQYYCGKILPDSSAIARGFVSRDLDG